jgi:hypothetical protein
MADDEPVARLRPRTFRWLVLGGVVVVAAGAGVVGLDHRQRNRVPARPAIEEGFAGYAACLGEPSPYEAWARGAELPAICRTTLGALDAPFVDRDGYAQLFDAVTLAEPWVRSEGDKLYIGGRYERFVDGKLTGGDGIARHAAGEWTRVELAGDVERMRWQDDGPWAIVRREPKTPLRVALHRDGDWSERVELPRITAVEAMRSTGDGRVLVARRSDGMLVVIRLDAEAQTVLETVDLVKIDRRPTLVVTPAGDVTAIWQRDDGDADLIFLAAGATTPRRTTEAATGVVFDQCLVGRDLWLRFGARLLHSADGGATLTEVPGLDSLEWHHLDCGPGWLAGLETDGDSYVVCRTAGCTRAVFTTRDFQRLALSRAGDDVLLLAQTSDTTVLWKDPRASGTPELRGLWSLDSSHTLVQLDGTWFHTSSADRGAY